jgi:high affinity Mn2+ porin
LNHGKDEQHDLANPRSELRGRGPARTMNRPPPQADRSAPADRRGAPATFGWAAMILAASSLTVRAQDAPSAATTNAVANVEEQKWNWHIQNTDIVQGDPGFPAKYSGPNSLGSGGEIRETVSLDLFAGVRLWRGAEAHMDGLMWQGFGLSKTLGVEGFPNGEAFRLGTKVPNLNIPRLFIRQTIGLGGEQETVEDDQLHLAGKQDVSRITLTLGKMSA